MAAQDASHIPLDPDPTHPATRPTASSKVTSFSISHLVRIAFPENALDLDLGSVSLLIGYEGHFSLFPSFKTGCSYSMTRFTGPVSLTWTFLIP